MAELPWIERTFQAAQKAAADAEDTSRVKIVFRGGVVVGAVHVTAQTNYDQFNQSIHIKQDAWQCAALKPKSYQFWIQSPLGSSKRRCMRDRRLRTTRPTPRDLQ